MALNPHGGGQECPSSSSSSRPNRGRKLIYDVFLSFRGKDTRLKFTDHLFSALQADGVMITFRDNEELRERGEALKPSLLHAIEESFSAIVVLSKNYANSTWCLDELAMIFDCHKEWGLKIFPIFYEVEPSDVRYQTGAFEADFKKHEEEYEHDKVQRWREAFEAVANLPGRSSRGYESELIKDMVKWVRSELYGQAQLGSNDGGLVGMGGKIVEIESIIAKESIEEVKFIGIYGMGGLGKTTLVRAVYDKYKSNYAFYFFLPNVRERSATNDGLSELQLKLLSLPNRRNEMEVGDCEEGKNLIRIRLHKRKVLLVLDDVSDISQLENLAGEKAWFGPGSRIIITTRDQRLLFEHGVDPHHQYKMKFLTRVQSYELFFQKAFRGDEELDEDYLKLSEQVIQSSNGLPLALKVFGSFLCGRSKAQWEEALTNIYSSDDDRVTRMLKVSFDRLGQNEKNIFLDIACFFNGMTKKYIIQTLQDCGLLPEIGIQCLIEKSLVTEEKGCLCLHDTIQEMGKKIVCDSHDDAGERSRIWSLEDAKHVLGNKKGSKAIRGIAVRFDKPDVIINVDHEAFLSMSNLKLLIMLDFAPDQLKLPNGLTSFSNTLKVIQWDTYPLYLLPEKTQFDQLVSLKMQYSKLKQLWRRTNMSLNCLKSIDLSHSTNLIRTPDFNETPNLQRLVLEGCTKLHEVHHSLGQHENLVEVNFKDCKRIKTLPSKFEMNCLEKFVLDGCLEVKTLPEFGEGMKCLIELHLQQIAISELPESLVNLTGLIELDLKSCKNMVCFPNDFQKLKAIKIIDVWDCSNFSKLPKNLNENAALEELVVAGTAIKEVPSSLNKLTALSLRECKLRRPLPNLPSLVWLDLSYCDLDDASLPSEIGNLPSLTSLFLIGNHFVEFPSGLISKLGKLQLISFRDCQELRSFPQLPSSVSMVFATECPLLEDYVRDEQLLWEFLMQFDYQTPRPTRQISQDDGLNIHYFNDGYSMIETWDAQVPKFFMQPTRILTITGNEVPSWFHNQDYFYAKDLPYDTQTNVSFKVNMSSSSELWGLGVCLVLRVLQEWKFDNDDKICWTYKDLDGEYSTSSRGFFFRSLEICHHLSIICIRFSSFFVENLQMAFFAMNEDASSRRIQIVKCGWRALSKEDAERWHNTRN